MRSLLNSVVLASIILTTCTTNAINLIPKRDGASPKVVQHQIQRRHIANPIEHDRNRLLRKRDGTVTASLTNEETLYFMTVNIGTPSQELKLHIDTGSSDLWVNSGSSSLCKSAGDACGGAGTYNANSSSTYQYVNSDFNITYVDGTGAEGDYAADAVSFAGITLQQQIFGIGYDSTSQEGVLGIGYPINEAAVKAGYESYPNVPQNMLESGIIKSNVYSLWLDDIDASTGQIVFGGVNTAKYSGELATLPIIPQGDVYAEFVIALTAIGMDGNSGSLASDQNIGALLDSGSSLMYLPEDVANKIYKQLGATYESGSGFAVVDCDLGNTDKTLDFTFSSPTISVPMSELVIPNGNECILGIGMSSGTAILGDTFIRSAYIVYDLSNNEISIAQTDFTSTSDNVVEIGKGDAVPSATAVQGAVTSVSDSSGGSVNVGFASASGNAAMPTAALGYNMALLGAVGAAAFAL